MRSRRSRTDEYETPPELMVDSALMLVSHLPIGKRAYALRSLAEHYRSMYAELEEPQPEWVRMLSQVADQEGSASADAASLSDQ
jgi:hypothetical protein